MLLDRLLRHPFLATAPPKACGRETFGEEFLEWMLRFRGTLRPENLVATATRFAAASIARAVREFLEPRGRFEEVVLARGGVYNVALVQSLRDLLPHMEFWTSDECGVPARAAAAVGIAILANETLHGRPANLPAATGDRRPVILGCIVPGRPGGDG